MKSATVRQIQHHFKDVLSWIENGEEVEVTSRRQAVARLIPPRPSPGPRKVKWPDIKARLKAVYGDMTPLPFNPVLKEREEFSW